MKNRIEELRLARGWTKVELGDRLNVSRQTIHAIESGRYDPSLPLALAIAKLFKMPVEQIFGDDAEATIARNEIRAAALRKQR
jgi:putative transcriptional regulator